MNAKPLRIAFAGLGSMGLGMAKNLLAKGHTVIGLDVNPDACAALRAAGGEVEVSPKAAAARADALVIVVVSAAQVEQVLFGTDGAIGVLPKGQVVVQCATVPPGFSKALGERLAAAGHPLLDAPLSGGRARADTGELTIMSSGPAEAYAQAQPILDAVAAKVYRLGDAPGIGSLVKTVNQLLAGVHIAAAAEAMALGTKAGADPRALYDVISNSAGNSWMFANRVPHMLDGDFTPLSAVDIFVKDLGLVLDAGREVKQPLPLAAAAHQLFLMASAAGWGRIDDAAVVKIYEQMGGFSVAQRATKKT
jgi:3-hydroxyisobutyrate dehydrogenase